MSTRTSVGIAAGLLALTIAIRPVQAQQAAVRVPASVLERYVGEYLYPQGHTLKVIVVGDTLFHDFPGRRLATLHYVPCSALFRCSREFVIDQTCGHSNPDRRLRQGVPTLPLSPPVPLQRYLHFGRRSARSRLCRTDVAHTIVPGI